MAVRPKSVVVVPGAALAGVDNSGYMPESVMVQFARNFVVDFADYTPTSAEQEYLSAARFMSPELLSRFEPVAREQLKQVVTNRVSQFVTVESFNVEGKDPLVVRFQGERITYVGRTETERKSFHLRLYPPYMDGNGRIGRFLMDVMLAAGGYPSTVVPLERRDAYMATLEEARPSCH